MPNYRSISILPVLCKIIEIVTHSQLMHYFNVIKLFTTQQYGFREISYTELAALELMERNINNINKTFFGKYIYSDFSKAFHNLDHNILLCKITFYRLDDKVINLLRSYLNQFVQLSNIKSNHHLISVVYHRDLQPDLFLFNIVIIDLTSVTAKFDLVMYAAVMYAADTILIFILGNFGPTHNAKQLEQNINEKISKVATWLKSNIQKLNVSKSKCFFSRLFLNLIL